MQVLAPGTIAGIFIISDVLVAQEKITQANIT